MSRLELQQYKREFARRQACAPHERIDFPIDIMTESFFLLNTLDP